MSDLETAQAELERLQAQQGDLVGEANQANSAAAKFRDQLGAKVLDGGDLSELSAELAKMEREAEAKQAAAKAGSSLIAAARAALIEAKIESCVMAVAESENQFNDKNNGKGRLLVSVNKRIDELQDILDPALTEFSETVEYMPTPIKQTTEVKLRALRERLKKIRAAEGILSQQLGG